MENKENFNTDRFLKKATLYTITIICLIGSIMIVLFLINNKKSNEGLTGYFAIMEDDEAKVLRQIGILDPIATSNSMKAKDVTEEKMVKVALDSIVGGKMLDFITFNEDNLKSKVELIFNKKLKTIPNIIEYRNIKCEKNGTMYSCNTKDDDTSYEGHYEFSPDVFTMNGRNITFSSSILYYSFEDKYYTDSSMSTLICEGDSSCVYTSPNYHPRDVVANYYFNGSEFQFTELAIN